MPHLGRVAYIAIVTCVLGLASCAAVVGPTVPVPDVRSAPAPSTTDPGAASVSPAVATTQLLGVHMDNTWDGSSSRTATAMDAAQNVLGAEVARQSLLWHLVEPVKGAPDWSTVDNVVDGAVSHGMLPLLDLRGSPSWANGVPESTPDHYYYVPPPGPVFDQWVSDYATFVKQLATRYQGRVKMYEIWSEANLTDLWKPTPSAAQYSRLFTALNGAIHEVDPSAKVSVGGVAEIQAGRPGNVRGLDFLKQITEAGTTPAVVSVHPYPGQAQAPDTHIEWENNFDDIALVHSYYASIGQAPEMWVTEWGWSTSTVSTATQADYLRRALTMLRDQYTYVTVAVYFLDADRGPNFYYGLLDENFHPKPSATVFKDFSTG